MAEAWQWLWMPMTDEAARHTLGLVCFTVGLCLGALMGRHRDRLEHG
jgi:hypothetical protein